MNSQPKKNNHYYDNLSDLSNQPITTAINTSSNKAINAIMNQANSTMLPFDPFKTLSISADEKEYLETIEIAADLLASEVITPQEYFKLKMLLKSKDSEVKNTAYIFLNLKGKL